MQNNKLWIRLLIGCLALTIMLIPPFITAMVWTTINLIIAIIAISFTVVSTFIFPRIRWLLALVSAIIIAIPPYPTWIFWSPQTGWRLGLSLSVLSSSIVGSVISLVMELMCFAGLFWAFNSSALANRSLRTRKSKRDRLVDDDKDPTL